MAKKRIIDTRFWDDGYVQKLDPSEKLLFLYYLTNSLTNIAGIYEIGLKRMALDTGLDEEMIKIILKRFEKDKKIFYIDEWIYIRNYLKYQETSSPKIKKGIQLALKDIPKRILAKIKENGYPIDTLSIPYIYPMDTLSYSNSNSNSNSNPNRETLKKLKDDLIKKKVIKS